MPAFLKSIRQEFAWVIRISRPRFWIYLFGPYLIGLLCALRVTIFQTFPLEQRLAGLEHLGSLTKRLPSVLIQDPMTAAILLLATILIFFYPLLPANLLLYGVNDLYDMETDALNPKKDGYEPRLLATRKRRLVTYIILSQLPWIFIIIALFVASVSIAHLWTLPVALIFCIFVFLSVFYSAPPIRAKARPYLDSLFNILYLMPGLAGYFLLRVSYDGYTIPFPWLPFLAGACWCMAMHAYSAVPDIEADTKAGLRTIATTLGRHKTLLLCLILYASSAALASFSVQGFILRLILLCLGLVYVIMMNISLTQADDLMPIYRRFPLVNTLVGMTLFFALLLF